MTGWKNSRMKCICCGRKFAWIGVACRQCGFPYELTNALRHSIADLDLPKEVRDKYLEQIFIVISAWASTSLNHLFKRQNLKINNEATE